MMAWMSGLSQKLYTRLSSASCSIPSHSHLYKRKKAGWSYVSSALRSSSSSNGKDAYPRLARLTDGLKYERMRGYGNTQGKQMTFSAFLELELGSLSKLFMGAHDQQYMQDLLQLVREYEGMSTLSRKQLLNDLDALIERLQNEDIQSRIFSSTISKPHVQVGMDSSAIRPYEDPAATSSQSPDQSPGVSLFHQKKLVAPSVLSDLVVQIDKDQKSNYLNQEELLMKLKNIELNTSFSSMGQTFFHDESIVCIGVDCETNSFSGPMLELAAVNYNTGEIWTTLINPGNIVFNQAAYKIHNISQDMVQAPGVPDSAEACRQFLAWLYQQSGGEKMVLMGYNGILFDFPIIQKELVQASMNYLDEWYYLDVLKWAQHAKAKRRLNSCDYKLTSLKEALNIEINGAAHRADTDVIVMGHVVAYLLTLQPAKKRSVEAVARASSSYAGKFLNFPAKSSYSSQANIQKIQKVGEPKMSSRSLHLEESDASNIPVQKSKKKGSHSSSDQSSLQLLHRNIDLAKFFTPKQRSALVEAGFVTVLQIAHYFPRDYSTYDKQVSSESIGALVVLVVDIEELSQFYKGNLMIVAAKGSTRSGQRVHWTKFFAGNRGIYAGGTFVRKNPEGSSVIVRGKLKSIGVDGVATLDGNVEIVSAHPDSEVNTILPVYSARTPIKADEFGGAGEKPGIMSKLLKELGTCKQDFEFFEKCQLEKLGLMGWHEAMRAMHNPTTEEEKDTARRRFVFQDMFFLQLVKLARRHTVTHQPGVQASCISSFDLMDTCQKSLPFVLTRSQSSSLNEILDDLGKSIPMLRLLQGDVGSGKTVVALLAMLAAVGSGFQACLAAPVTVLAHQHYNTFLKFVSNLPKRKQPKMALLTGSTRGVDRRNILADLESGDIDILIGTHALFNQKVEYKKLAFVVIDEQHRFGVQQREALNKANGFAHVLLMSATPIPRTLALTVHGSLLVSELKDMPPGRTPVTTDIIDHSKRRDLAKMFKDAREELDSGGRVFMVFSLIEESSSEIMKEVKSIEEEMKLMKEEKTFGEHGLGFVHGKLPAEEKSKALEQFASGKVPVLVATTVIEVGMDIPEASFMIVNNAERFGLAQLHQLRGRVGRGQRQSRCILLTKGGTVAMKRLEVLESTTDGQVIAEEDLKLRGPGDLLGLKQHGHHGFFSVTTHELLHDRELVEVARAEATKLLAENDYTIPSRLKSSLEALDFPMPEDSSML